MKKRSSIALIIILLAGFSATAFAGAAKTDYPVIFAHGMLGFDDVLGMDYFGNDFGIFVGDPCDGFLEMSCNGDLDDDQMAYATQVYALESSDVRGLQLADAIESYMALHGVSHVNIIGHSQGGIDARKAARLLYERKGYTVVKVLMSVSSPHRGSPVAKAVLETYPVLGDLVDFLGSIFGDIIYEPGNDGKACLMSLMYDDHSPSDGVTTGLKDFNQRYPVNSGYAARYVSFITAQNGVSLNPALMPVKLIEDIDGDGYCQNDCNDDGAAGCGDGNSGNLDDDGVVGINSQQMGYRLSWNNIPMFFDYVSTDYSMGYVGNINYPNNSQMTSLADVINQDHLDVVGIGPDTFDELEFYAAAIDYIAYFD